MSMRVEPTRRIMGKELPTTDYGFGKKWNYSVRVIKNIGKNSITAFGRRGTRLEVIRGRMKINGRMITVLSFEDLQRKFSKNDGLKTKFIKL